MCAICIRWVVRGDGIFAPSDTTLSTMSLPRVSKSAHVFWMVIRGWGGVWCVGIVVGHGWRDLN